MLPKFLISLMLLSFVFILDSGSTIKFNSYGGDPYAAVSGGGGGGQ